MAARLGAQHDLTQPLPAFARRRWRSSTLPCAASSIQPRSASSRRRRMLGLASASRRAWSAISFLLLFFFTVLLEQAADDADTPAAMSATLNIVATHSSREISGSGSATLISRCSRKRARPARWPKGRRLQVRAGQGSERQPQVAPPSVRKAAAVTQRQINELASRSRISQNVYMVSSLVNRSVDPFPPCGVERFSADIADTASETEKHGGSRYEILNSRPRVLTVLVGVWVGLRA